MEGFEKRGGQYQMGTRMNERRISIESVKRERRFRANGQMKSGLRIKNV